MFRARISRLSPRVSALLAGFLLLCADPALSASEAVDGAPLRISRHLSAEDGLEPEAVYALAQDSSGFLWIGTAGGLFRYDGSRMVPWSPQFLSSQIDRLASSPLGSVVAVVHGRGPVEVSPEGVLPVLGPSGNAVASATAATFTADGDLWLVSGGRLLRRTPAGTWSSLAPDAFTGESPQLLRADGDSRILVATHRSVWELDEKSRPRRLASLARVVDLSRGPDGSIWAITFPGRIVQLTGGGAKTAFELQARGISLAWREDTLWAAFDRFLVALSTQRPPEVLSVADGIESGGPLLVDREGSLWLGSFTGLFQFPEPDTRLWNARKGLPSPHVRYLAKQDDAIWVATWQGSSVFRRDHGAWHTRPVTAFSSISRPCPAPDGTMWVGTSDGLVQLRDGQALRHLDLGSQINGCAAGPQETLWVATDAGLVIIGPRGRARPGPALPGKAASDRSSAVFFDHQGRLWASDDEKICGPRSWAPGGSRHSGAWRCGDVRGAGGINSLYETESGDLWVATHDRCVVHLVNGKWEELPGCGDLASRTVFNLRASPRGGVWLLGEGIAIRVEPSSGDQGPWKLEERLGAWQGLPYEGAADLVETASGTLWVADARGVFRVPASARRLPERAPPVVIVDGRVDRRELRIDRAVELPYRRNRLELRFAALSFRDPERLRLQVRLNTDDAWTPIHGDPNFRWVDLPPGRYQAEVRASIDGTHWTHNPAFLAFAVDPPWYLEPWALAVGALLALAGLYFAYRLRLAYLLGLERQRSRIAMDLHDELGSGLGSIGILSNVLSQRELDEQERRRLGGEIAETAVRLGASLTDIVWSLDPRTNTLGELATRLVERGARLFPNERTELFFHLPDPLPEDRLSLPLRRDLLLVGLEALHNVARHASASRVELSLEGSTPSWRLTVTDDGIGMDPELDSKGHGLASLRKRAGEIGAEISWSSAPGEGTEVTLIFSTQAGSRRLGRLFRLSRKR